MGQRTQIIIQNIQPYKNEQGEEMQNVFTTVYHDQWGYGFFMMRDILNYITSKGYKYDYYDKSGKAVPQVPEFCGDADNITKHFEGMLNTSLLITSIQGMQQYAKLCDNNNGWCLLRLQRNKYGNIKAGEIFFFKGREECRDYEGNQIEEPCSRVVSLKEYIEACYRRIPTQWEKDEDGNLVPPQDSSQFEEVKQFANAFRAILRCYEIKPGKLSGNATIRKAGEPGVIDIQPQI